MTELSVVEDFFEYHCSEGSGIDRKFVLLTPGSYEYLVHPSGDSLRWLADRFNGDSLTRTVASVGMRTISHAHPFVFALLPGIQTFEMSVPRTCPLDIAIFGGRIKLLEFDNELAYTLLPENGKPLKREVALRRTLPEAINVPEIRHVDDTFPFFAEEFVSGYTPSRVVGDWDEILDGLRQLSVLHRETTSEWIPTQEIVARIFGRISGSELDGDPVIARARSFLDDHPLPDTLRRCRIHGDYQIGNILIRDSETYVLDWEFSRNGFGLYDMFSVFKRPALESSGGGPLSKLVFPDGSYGNIAEDLAATLGPVAYDEDEYFNALPILYVLLELYRTPPGKSLQDHFAYDLLGDVLPFV